MIAIAFVLWLVLGITISMLGLERYFGATSAFLWAVSITFLPIFAGGYISARRITPNSVLHPVLAAVLVALLCLLAFARGNLGLLPVGVIGAAAIAGAMGALLGLRTATPPNNRWRGP
jgi:biotin transporter BioY